MAFHYVMIDCNKIQEYVFSSTKLKEICNASFLLDHLETKLIPKIAEEFSGEIIRSGGGIVITKFKDDKIDTARKFLKKSTELYRKNGLAITCEIHTVDVVKNFCNDVLEPLLNKINTKKQSPKGVDFNISSILAVPCKVSGKGYAGRVEIERYGVKGIPVSYGESRKCHFARNIHPVEQELVDEIKGVELPQDFGGIVSWKSTLDLQEKPPGTSEDRILGIIYADVNGLGSLTTHIAQDESVYSSFCIGLRGLLANVLKESIKPVIEKEISRNKGNSLPFKILYVGGDDLAIAVKGCYAMDIAENLLRKFEEKSQQFICKSEIEGIPEHLTISAGLVLAPYNYPIRSFNLIGRGLENNAKHTGRLLQNEKKLQVPPSLIDFCIIKNNSLGSLQDVRHPKKGEDRLLYGCPYTPDEFSQFKHAAWELYHKEFPRNKMKKLSDILTLNTENAKYQYTIWWNALGKKEQNTYNNACKLLNLPPPPEIPFLNRYGQKMTTVIDLMELIGLYSLTFQEV